MKRSASISANASLKMPRVQTPHEILEQAKPLLLTEEKDRNKHHVKNVKNSLQAALTHSLFERNVMVAQEHLHNKHIYLKDNTLDDLYVFLKDWTNLFDMFDMHTPHASSNINAIKAKLRMELYKHKLVLERRKQKEEETSMALYVDSASSILDGRLFMHKKHLDLLTQYTEQELQKLNPTVTFPNEVFELIMTFGGNRMFYSYYKALQTSERKNALIEQYRNMRKYEWIESSRGTSLMGIHELLHAAPPPDEPRVAKTLVLENIPEGRYARFLALAYNNQEKEIAMYHPTLGFDYAIRKQEVLNIIAQKFRDANMARKMLVRRINWIQSSTHVVPVESENVFLLPLTQLLNMTANFGEQEKLVLTFVLKNPCAYHVYLRPVQTTGDGDNMTAIRQDYPCTIAFKFPRNAAHNDKYPKVFLNQDTPSEHPTERHFASLSLENVEFHLDTNLNQPETSIDELILKNALLPGVVNPTTSRIYGQMTNCKVRLCHLVSDIENLDTRIVHQFATDTLFCLTLDEPLTRRKFARLFQCIPRERVVRIYYNKPREKTDEETVKVLNDVPPRIEITYALNIKRFP